jgi:UDP-glucose 4-epimerase
MAASTMDVPQGEGIDASAFNIATARETSVLELADAVGAAMDTRPDVEHAPERSGELFRSSLNIDKAKSVLQWEPQSQFGDGLQDLITWFQQEAQ